MKDFFYHFFFTNFENFVNHIHLGKTQYVWYENSYNDILRKYQRDLPRKIVYENLDLLVRQFSEEKLCDSIDLFFHIIGQDKIASGNVENLISFVQYGGNQAEERNVVIEDRVVPCILRYFWNRVNRRRLQREGIDNRKSNFFRGHGRTYDYETIIDLIDDLLLEDLNATNYNSVTPLLKYVKEIRNHFAHINTIELPVGEAINVDLLTIYSFITATLYLKEHLEIEYHSKLELHLNITNDVNQKDIKVELYDKDNNRILPKDNNGCTFIINRYQEYRMSVKRNTSVTFIPQWDSKTPIVTFDGDDLTYKPNENEATAKERGATLNTIQRVNEQTNEILNGIRADNNEHAEEYSSQLKKLIEIISQYKLDGEKEWIRVCASIEGISKECSHIKTDIQAEGDKTRNEVKKNRLISAIILVLLTVIVGCLIWKKCSSEQQLTAEELLAKGDSLSRLGLNYDANEAYLKAIDAFNRRIANNDQEEDARIKLTNYYLSINDKVHALETSKPMADVKQYKNGCEVAAEAMYQNALYSDVWRIIELYKSEYSNPMPTGLQCLEGVMLLKGEGCEPRGTDGLKILHRLAESGYARAQYWSGLSLCSNEMNFKEGRLLDSPIEHQSNYDLVAAADYFLVASTKIPEAALELGKLYADLNVADSATKYLDLVINSFNTPEIIKQEAKYQKALYTYTSGKQTEGEKLFKDLAGTGYPKAKLFEAFINEDHRAAVNIYENLYKQEDYEPEDLNRYIDPIVFEYLYIGEDVKALDRLVTTRPEGAFDMDFINGMKFFMLAAKEGNSPEEVKADSTIAMNYMKKSATKENKCLYAKMICDYYEAKSAIRQGKHPIALIKEIGIIAKTIPFANYLKALLLVESNNDNYTELEGAALSLLGAGKPVGAYLLSFMPQGFYSQISELLESPLPNDDLFVKRCLIQAALRHTVQWAKVPLIYTAYHIERKIVKDLFDITPFNGENNNHTFVQLHFWANVAIGNHAFYLECQLLPIAMFIKDKTYALKIIEAALNDFPEMPLNTVKQDNQTFKELTCTKLQSHCMSILSSFLKSMPQDYYNSIMQMYYDNEVLQNYIFSPVCAKDTSIDASPDLYTLNLPILGQFDIFRTLFIDNGLHLLNEFSDVGKKYYHVVFDFK